MVAVMTIESTLHERILENLNEAIMLFDDQMSLLYMNPAAEMLFGASFRQLKGLTLSELVQPREPIQPRIEEALRTFHPFTKHEQQIELMYGKEITADFTVNILQSSEGVREILLEIITLERLLRISRDEALVSQQNATRDLLRGLAHEVKNPLGGLRGAAQLLEKELVNDDMKEYTQVIISEADRLQKLVNRLLGPSGMPKIEAFNIHEVLEYVRNIIIKNKQKDILLHRDYDPSIPDIRGDKDQIIQAVLNIASNAMQALGSQGNITFHTRVMRHFTIAAKQHRLVAIVEIIDDGPGIPPDLKDRIFIPMVTGRAEGSGLGLSIAQKLIQQNGGLIECVSRPGQTVFSIILPIDDTEISEES
jgi:two-component system nitrogen regulation sensor histidine kinase GlnL